MKNRDEILREEEAKQLLGELYQKYHGTARGVIYNILREQVSKEDIEDLVQDGFFRLLHYAENLVGRSEGEQRSYICNCMRFVALDARRKLNHRKTIGLPEVWDLEFLIALNVFGLSPEEKYILEEEWNEYARILRPALKKLSKQDYLLLTERYFNELSDREIGRKLKIKEAFVRVYMDRARKRAAAHCREAMNEEQRRRFDKKHKK